jgi:hypothetical protein
VISSISNTVYVGAITRKRAREAEPRREESTEGQFKHLVPDILGCVASFFSLNEAVQLGNVCRSWRQRIRISIDLRVQNTVSISYRELVVFRRMCAPGYWAHRPRWDTTLRAFRNLTTFTLGTVELSLTQLSAIGKVLSTIQVIDGSGQNFTSKKLRIFLSDCSNLETLSVAGSLDLHSSWVRWFPTTCPSIRELDLSGTPIPDCVLGALAAHCTKLQRVNITACKQVTDEGINYLLDKNIEVILREDPQG